MRLTKWRAATVSLVVLLCCLFVFVFWNRHPPLPISVVVSYRNYSLNLGRKKFPGDRVDPEQSKPIFTSGVILEVTEGGMLRWRDPRVSLDFNSRQLTNTEMEEIRNRIQTVVTHFDKDIGPSTVGDIATIYIRLKYGDKEVEESYTSGFEHFFSGEPLSRAFQPRGLVDLYRSKRAYRRIEDLNLFLISLCVDDKERNQKQRTEEH